MAHDDDEVIEQARLRQAHGNETELDRWRLRTAARREEQAMTRNTDTDVGAAWANWVHDRIHEVVKDVADALGGLAEEAGAGTGRLEKRLRELELTVARLEGELRGQRGQNVAATAKFIGDAIEEPLCGYIDERVKAMRREAKSEVIDLPSWRRHGT
jgi:hypothetical protein